MTTIKLKDICLVRGNGVYETKDVRYDVKTPIKKVIRYCLKYGFSFKVGFHDNKLISNKNYIEITSDAFTFHVVFKGIRNNSVYRERFDRCCQLKKWLKELK